MSPISMHVNENSFENNIIQLPVDNRTVRSHLKIKFII